MDTRETRLRARIDQLLDRAISAEEKLARERQQVAHLNRRVNALLRQREFWKRRASVVHELNLLAKRRRWRSTHGS